LYKKYLEMKNLLLFLSLFIALPVISKKVENRPQVLLVTSLGNIRLELYNEAPLHRDNFLKLVKSGFYDSLLFHRVIKDWVIQAGDPVSKHAAKGVLLGDSSPNYLIPAEFTVPYHYHKRGVLGMAREGDDVNPERFSCSSQFYIVWGRRYKASELNSVQAKLDAQTDGQVQIDEEMTEDYETIGGAPSLDGQYTVFGEVIEGMDVVDKIRLVLTDKNDRPVNDIRIIKASVIKK
jgi:cyclophilin family peptidyl-prolyl cis-trans isomerase